MLRGLVLLLLLAPALPRAVAAEVPVPPLRGRVNDLADVLDAGQREALEAELAAFERETSHQIVVLTVPSLEGEAIESFSLRVVEDWKLGRADLDNGVLFLVVPAERRARIEVGYGLEGVIPDAIASRILRDVVFPRFREGQMGEGVVAGSEALMAAARREPVPLERRPRDSRGARGDPFGAVFFCAFLGGLAGGVLGRRRRLRGALIGAAVAGGVGWLLLSSLPLAGLASLLGGFFAAGGPLGRGGGLGRRRHGHVGPGWGGGLGGGGLGGGGGGFGGGGGGFGGGGASGSW